jgi:translation elongation factor EF-Tu-like GTPase
VTQTKFERSKPQIGLGQIGHLKPLKNTIADADVRLEGAALVVTNQ